MRREGNRALTDAVLNVRNAGGAAFLGLFVALSAGCNQDATLRPAVVAHSQPAVTSRPAVADRVRNPVVDSAESAAGPTRIVTLAPSATEFCAALGLRERIVGRTQYCVYPPGLEAVLVLGGAHDLSAERLVSLQPELILVTGTTRGQIERLAGLGLTWRVLRDETLDDILESARMLGEWTGRPKTGAALAEQIRADIERVGSQYRRGPTRRVLLAPSVLSDPPTPPTVAGPGSFYDELLRRAGHTNAAPAGGRSFGPLSLEAILTADPEVILELAPDHTARPGGDADAAAAWGRIGPLRAVREGRVRVVVGAQYYLPGPRIAETMVAIGEAIVREGP